MKNKSWIIIVIMGIALAISIGYSINISKKTKAGESTVTTTSVIEMTATTATIKNTLKGSGLIEYKEKINNEKNAKTSGTVENSENVESSNTLQDDFEKAQTGEIQADSSEINKTYQISLTIEDKDLKKAKVGQEVEITVKNDEQNLNYTGIVKKIKEDINNKSTLNIEITNPDDNIKEGTTATCTVIVEKVENVVALPIEAVQTNELSEKYVDVVQIDGNTKSVIIKTGLSDDYYVEITSGLSVGDRVQIIKSSTTVVNKVNETNKNLLK